MQAVHDNQILIVIGETGMVTRLILWAARDWHNDSGQSVRVESSSEVIRLRSYNVNGELSFDAFSPTCTP